MNTAEEDSFGASGETHLLLSLCNRLIRGCNSLVFCCASLYIVSGVMKFLSPNDSVDTVKLLFNNILRLDITYSYVTLSVFGLVAWEIILGSLCLIGISRKIVRWALAGTNLLFIVVSHYLAHINRLDSCGCLGGYNKAFSAVHFPVLYVFSAAIMFVLFAERTMKREIFNRYDRA